MDGYVILPFAPYYKLTINLELLMYLKIDYQATELKVINFIMLLGYYLVLLVSPVCFIAAT